MFNANNINLGMLSAQANGIHLPEYGCSLISGFNPNIKSQIYIQKHHTPNLSFNVLFFVSNMKKVNHFNNIVAFFAAETMLQWRLVHNIFNNGTANNRINVDVNLSQIIFLHQNELK